MGYRLRKSGSQLDAILAHSIVSLEGSYSSLSALQTAFPSGDEGLYKIEDKWYYWNANNLAWTEGGDISSLFTIDENGNMVISSASGKVIYDGSEIANKAYVLDMLAGGGGGPITIIEKAEPWVGNDAPNTDDYTTWFKPVSGD